MCWKHNHTIICAWDTWTYHLTTTNNHCFLSMYSEKLPPTVWDDVLVTQSRINANFQQVNLQSFTIKRTGSLWEQKVVSKPGWSWMSVARNSNWMPAFKYSLVRVWLHSQCIFQLPKNIDLHNGVCSKVTFQC